MAVPDMEPNALQSEAVELLGGMVICFCFAFIFYGITVTQTYIYMLNSKDDPLWIKIWVMTLSLLETLHSAFSMRLFYYTVVLSFGRLDMVGLVDWSFGAAVFVENMIVAMVDIFFIRRLWILSNHSYILTVGTSLLLLGRIGCHTAAGALALTTGVWSELRANRGPNIAVEVANVLSATIDGIIAISLIYFLYHRQSGQEKTDGVVRWIMGYAINSGAIMMVVSLTITITYAKVQESLLFIGLVIAIGKIYANSLLGSLNARRFLRGMNTHGAGTGGSRPNAIELSKIQASSTQRPIEIYREKTQITDAMGAQPVDISNHSWELQTTTLDDDSSSQGKKEALTVV